LPDFSEILYEKAVFHRILAMGQIRRSTERIFCFPDAAWASASGAFRILSDTLVLKIKGLGTQCHIFQFHDTAATMAFHELV